ncbi:MAG: hypothetical protein AAGE59_36500 [Cyanobacteria bacterium P01_F01_bin.86]
MKIKQLKPFIPIGLITITPLIYVTAFLLLSHQNGPYWLPPNQDPDYAYLFNSLAVANFLTPGHTDHPGTPLQILGALTIGLIHTGQSLAQSVLGQPTLSVNESVLRQPELYLHGINYVLVGLNAIGIFVVGLVLFWVSNRLLLAVLIQLTPLLFVKTIAANEPSRVAPEALIFFLSQLLATLLVLYLFRRDVEKKRWFALGLGTVFGLGMAAKITFLPAIIFGLVIAGYRLRLLALGMSVVAFVVATLPIVSEYGRVWQWLVGILFYSEQYGTGNPGLPSLAILKTRLTMLFESDTVFLHLSIIASVMCLVAVIELLLNRADRSAQGSFSSSHFTSLDTKRRQLIIWLTILMWSQILITIMESANSRYLALGVSLCGLLLVLIVMSIESITAYRNWIPYSGSITCLLIYALCIGISVQQYDASYGRVVDRAERQLQQIDELEKVLSKPQHQGCLIARERRASSQLAAIFYGNKWADLAFAAPLNEIYPGSAFILYKSLNNPKKPLEFWDFGDKTETAGLLAGGTDCILIHSKLMERDRDIEKGERFPRKVKKDATLKNLLPKQSQMLYLVNFKDKSSKN